VLGRWQGFLDPQPSVHGFVANRMSKSRIKPPAFKDEAEEADWWASSEGRAFVRAQAADAKTKAEKSQGSRLVAQLNKVNSVQIALRLPEADLAEARRIAERKGIGYQTLLKMLLHEGLQREARRG
jgi:predicted DNA binding CopG/RHH family protein